jgi:hypothetical protein
MTHENAAVFDTDPVLDLIRTAIPEGKPDWTENIAWSMADPKSGVSIFGHLGRLQPDRRIWEGLSLIYLPDGSTLVNRSLGISLAEARNGEYHYQPLLPNKLWRYSFDGVAQRVRPDELRRRPIGDAPFEVTAYDLTFDAVQPVFNMHRSDASSDRMHLEHGGRMRGMVMAGGQRFDIDCTAYRDHSMSQRTFTTLDSETWANCVFPSGRIFSVLEVRRGDRQILEGQIYHQGLMRLAKPLDVPALTDTAGNPSRGVLAVESEGERFEIAWELLDAGYAPFQLLRPVGMRPGLDHADPTNMAVLECPTKYIWDGEVGYGWLERSRPLSALGG